MAEGEVSSQSTRNRMHDQNCCLTWVEQSSYAIGETQESESVSKHQRGVVEVGENSPVIRCEGNTHRVSFSEHSVSLISLT